MKSLPPCNSPDAFTRTTWLSSSQFVFSAITHQQAEYQTTLIFDDIIVSATTRFVNCLTVQDLSQKGWLAASNKCGECSGKDLGFAQQTSLPALARPIAA